MLQCLKYSDQLGNDKSELGSDKLNWAVTNTGLIQALSQAATQH